MILAWLALIGGLLLLAGGGESIISGAVRLARRLGVQPLVIGLTVVAVGTSAPELGVALSATLAGQPDITMGNLVGSNIANIGLVLGVGALVRPLPVGLRLLKMEVPLLLAVSLLVMLLGTFGTIYRWGGILLLVPLVLYMAAGFRWSTEEPAEVQKEFQEEMGRGGLLFLQLLLIAIGILLLVIGAKLLVWGAVELARYFHVSELVIGLSVTAIGTSVPEMATTVSAARKGHGDIVLGNVVGSNLANLTGVLGITSLITPVHVEPEVTTWHLPVMMAMSLALLPVMRSGMCIHRWEGLLLLSVYLLYIFTLLVS